MTAYEIITKKRNGNALSEDEIQYFIRRYLENEIEDYQMSALLMAIFFQGLSVDETLHLTRAYLESGETLDLSDIAGRKIDKHSTGGVGDKVSIILAPLAASLDVIVPMMSGRGLGHTGGTLDKLESIPGFQVKGELKEYRRQLSEIGLAMFGQTESIVPADRRIYALRDVTATVDSIPLITASIMSKKIAEGIDGLVLDVKTGNGAFIPDFQRAEELANSLIRVGRAFHVETIAYLTSMVQPLGYKIGNWLEIEECIDCLQGNGPDDVMEVVLNLTSEMLVMAGKSEDAASGINKCRKALDDGSAFDKFLELIRRQGGDISVVEHPEKYEKAGYRKEVVADRSGILSEFDTREIGMTSVLLGAGRERTGDEVDPAAGIVLHRKVGDEIHAGDIIFELFTNRKSVLEQAEHKILNAVRIQDQAVKKPELIVKKIE